MLRFMVEERERERKKEEFSSCILKKHSMTKFIHHRNITHTNNLS